MLYLTLALLAMTYVCVAFTMVISACLVNEYGFLINVRIFSIVQLLVGLIEIVLRLALYLDPVPVRIGPGYITVPDFEMIIGILLSMGAIGITLLRDHTLPSDRLINKRLISLGCILVGIAIDAFIVVLTAGTLCSIGVV